MQLVPEVMGADKRSWEKCVHEQRGQGQTPGKFIFKFMSLMLLITEKTRNKIRICISLITEALRWGPQGQYVGFIRDPGPLFSSTIFSIVCFIPKFALIIKWPQQVLPSHCRKQESGRGEPSEPAFKEVFPEEPPHNFCLHQPELSPMTYLQGKLGNVVLQLGP